SSGAANSAMKSGAGMKDAARDFAAALPGRELRVRLPQAGVHQFARLLLHRDRQFPAARRRHAAVNLDLERVGVGLVGSRQHEGNTTRRLRSRKLRATRATFRVAGRTRGPTAAIRAARLCRAARRGEKTAAENFLADSPVRAALPELLAEQIGR